MLWRKAHFSLARAMYSSTAGVRLIFFSVFRSQKTDRHLFNQLSALIPKKSVVNRAEISSTMYLSKLNTHFVENGQLPPPPPSSPIHHCLHARTLLKSKKLEQRARREQAKLGVEQKSLPTTPTSCFPAPSKQLLSPLLVSAGVDGGKIWQSGHIEFWLNCFNV